MDIDRDKIKQAARSLDSAASNLRRLADQAEAPVEELRNRLQTAAGQLETLKLLLEEPGDRFEFKEFLKFVGESFVAAQEGLDTQTRQYLKQSQPNEYVLPTVFRLPKVSARLKFALEKITDEKVNLIFYSKGNQARELNQQSLDFEIAAVPPPPEVIEKLKNLAPLLELVVSPTLRARVFTAIEKAQPPPAVRKEILLENRDKALIWETESPNRYLLLLALPPDPWKMGIWEAETGESPRLAAILKFVPKDKEKIEKGEDLKPLHELLLKLGERQAKYLAQD